MNSVKINLRDVTSPRLENKATLEMEGFIKAMLLRTGAPGDLCPRVVCLFHVFGIEGSLSRFFVKEGIVTMAMRNVLRLSLSSLLIACAILPVSVMSQETTTSSQGQNENTIEGTVVSSTRDTLVVKTEETQFQLFTIDRSTVKPGSLPPGTRVRVVSTPGNEAGARHATTIVTLEAPSGAQGSSPTQAQPIPPAVRDLERDIKREARRWRLGVRAGAGLDPELLLFGVHSQLGPIFQRDVFFRPNAEFAFGEVTDLIALNLEAIYRVPISSRQGRWSPYIGAGPGFTFLHQSFQSTAGQGRNIDFGNFHFNTGFNILTGVQFRRGTFFEVKTSLYSRPAPTLRLIFGYNF